jgi:hypothetical protein
MPLAMIQMMTGNFVQQRQMDDRHRHLCALYAFLTREVPVFTVSLM